VRREKPVSRSALWYHLEKCRSAERIWGEGASIIESIKTKVRYAKEGEVCLCMCAKSECVDRKTKEGGRDLQSRFVRSPDGLNYVN